MAQQRSVTSYLVKIGDFYETCFDTDRIGSQGITKTFEGFEGHDLTVSVNHIQPFQNNGTCIVLCCERQTSQTFYGTANIRFRPASLGGRYVDVTASPVAPLIRIRCANVATDTESTRIPWTDRVIAMDQQPTTVVDSLRRPERKRRRTVILCARCGKDSKCNSVPDPWLEEPLEAHDDERRCSWCLERAVATVIKPCRHATMCVKCARENFSRLGGQCPICRNPIHHIARLKLVHLQ